MTVRLSDFFAWILSTSLMASVLVVLILAAKWLLRDKLKPRWSFLLWLLLILRLVLPWAPESSFSVYNISHLFGETRHFAAGNETTITPADKPEIEGETPTQVSLLPQDPIVTIQRDETIKKPASPLQVASIIWLVGTMVFLASMFRANLRFARKLKGETAIMVPGIADLFGSCKEEMNLRRRIRLIQTNRVSSPTLFGLFRPKLLLPDMALQTLSEAQLRYVFLHELSHVRRNDIAWNGIVNILLALHWFNPFLWYAYHKMRVDQELACDALALSRVTPEESKEYALTIIKLLELFTKPIHLAGAASILGNKKELKRRIIMITSPVKNSYKWSIVGIIVLLLVGGAALTNANSNSEEKHREETTQMADAAIENQTAVWADAFKSRNGKPRYDMMSAKAKEKFVQEQVNRSGEDWNYNIGFSSPWVIDYRSKVDGMKAVITYVTQTSEPAYYKTVEAVTFAKKKGKLVVDDYETLLEGELIPTETRITKTDYMRMSNIIIAVNKGELPFSALKDAEPILRREGQLIGLSNSVREKYIKETGYHIITEDEYTKMSHIVGEVNAGNLPAEALKDADLLLERRPNMITPETRAKYLAFK